MTTNDQYRITKEASARKNTKQPNMHSSLEVAAIRASHEAYVSSMVSGYEEQKQSLQTDHEEQMQILQTKHDAAFAELKTQSARDQAAVNEKYLATIDTAITKAREESKQEIANLKTNNQLFAAEIKSLKTSLDESIAKNKVDRQTLSRERSQHLTQNSNLVAKHQNEVAAMQRKLDVGPNSWFELHFRSRKRKTRTYVERPNTCFSVVAEKLRKDLQVNFNPNFSHDDVPIKGHHQTLKQLNIEDGDEIWY